MLTLLKQLRRVVVVLGTHAAFAEAGRRLGGRVGIACSVPVALVAAGYLSAWSARRNHRPQFATLAYFSAGYLENHDEPAFLPEDKQPGWVKEVEKRAPEILEELGGIGLQLKDESRLSPGWRCFFYKIDHPDCAAEQAKLPITTEVMRLVPGKVENTVKVMSLAPHSTVFPHRGHTDAYYRCHLGLQVPAGLPQCGFQARDEVQPWRPFRLFMFTDALRHHAWNHSDGTRIILMFDAVRPEWLEHHAKIESYNMTLRKTTDFLLSPLFPLAAPVYTWTAVFGNMLW